jgi:tetratricopeptide (TPR) repeat protein
VEATPTPEPTPTATPEPAPAPAPAPTSPPETSPDPAAAAPLNNRGFALMQARRYEEALPDLQRAYELCQGSTQMDPCGYATFNYGASLRRSGNAAAAIPILEERLERFGDNQYNEVAEELEAARSQA